MIDFYKENVSKFYSDKNLFFLFSIWILTFIFGSSIGSYSFGSFTIYPNLIIGLFFIWNPLYQATSVFLSMFCKSPLIYYHYMALKAVNDTMPIRFRAFVEPASSSSKLLAEERALQQAEALGE